MISIINYRGWDKQLKVGDVLIMEEEIPYMIVEDDINEETYALVCLKTASIELDGITNLNFKLGEEVIIGLKITDIIPSDKVQITFSI